MPGGGGERVRRAPVDICSKVRLNKTSRQGENQDKNGVEGQIGGKLTEGGPRPGGDLGGGGVTIKKDLKLNRKKFTEG